MKVTLSMATSVNGMIADEDGSEDFLSHDNWVAFAALANKIGSNIWGRKTYESVKSWEGTYLKDIENVRKIIISNDESLQLDSGFSIATSPEDALAQLKAEGKEEALVTGGPTINSAFMQKGLVDEIILTVEPVVLGKGISLFSSSDFMLRLKLLETVSLTPGLLQLHYAVVK